MNIPDSRPKLKLAAPTRSVTEVGPGDYVKINGRWEKIVSNTAFGSERTPRNWTVETETGSRDMWGIDRYAKAQDVE